MQVTMTGYQDCVNDLKNKTKQIQNVIPTRLAAYASGAYYDAFSSLVNNFYNEYKPRVYRRTYKFRGSGRPRNSRNTSIGGLTVSSSYMHGDYHDARSGHTISADTILNQIWNDEIRYRHPVTHENVEFHAHIESYIGQFSGASPHVLMEQFQDVWADKVLKTIWHMDIDNILDS